MKPERVRRYGEPAYPTRPEVGDDPELLRRHVPERWRRADIAGVLGVFLAASLLSCDEQPAGPRPDGAPRAVQPPAGGGPERDRMQPAEAAVEAAAAVVAPVFQHGEGRCSVGGDIIAPAAFLSEEEALQVITEELTRAGLDLSTEPHVVEGVTTV